jgi:hypothetical protein
MTLDRRYLLIAVPLALLASMQAVVAQDMQAWDGTWKGLLGRRYPTPIAITIAQGKVVSYAVEGAPFDIQYSNIDPASVSFGDRDHYFMKLIRTGDATASGTVHGRLGYGFASLTKAAP